MEHPIVIKGCYAIGYADDLRLISRPVAEVARQRCPWIGTGFESSVGKQFGCSPTQTKTAIQSRGHLINCKVEDSGAPGRRISVAVRRISSLVLEGKHIAVWP